MIVVFFHLLLCALHTQANPDPARSLLQTHIRRPYELSKYKVISGRIDPDLQVGRGVVQDFDVDKKKMASAEGAENPDKEDVESGEEKSKEVKKDESSDLKKDEALKKVNEKTGPSFKPLKHKTRAIKEDIEDNESKRSQATDISKENDSAESDSQSTYIDEETGESKEKDGNSSNQDSKDKDESSKEKEVEKDGKHGKKDLEHGEDYMSADEAMFENEKSGEGIDQKSMINGEEISSVNRLDPGENGGDYRQDSSLQHQFNLQPKNEDILFSTDEVKVISELVQNRLSLLSVIKEKLKISKPNRVYNEENEDDVAGSLKKYREVEDEIMNNLPQNIESTESQGRNRKGEICLCGEILDEASFLKPERVRQAREDYRSSEDYSNIHRRNEDESRSERNRHFSSREEEKDISEYLEEDEAEIDLDEGDGDQDSDADSMEKNSNNTEEDYDEQTEDRIVNGYSVERREYYVALERKKGAVTCGGALISPRYVISAAHCFCVDLSGIFCQETFVTSDIGYKLVMGVTGLRDREGARYYGIESVRQPSERIALYSQGRISGPHDIALLRTDRRVIFEPGKIMPVCLGEVKDVNVVAHVTGLGSQASYNPSEKRADCWTDRRGPRIFHRCDKAAKCRNSSPPQHSVCSQFFQSFGGAEAFRSDQQVDVAEVNGKRCYATRGSGKYGWCKVGDSWGFCSIHCTLSGPRYDKELKETNSRILFPEDCKAMIPERMGYDPKLDLCGGQITSNFQRVFEFHDKGRGYEAGERITEDKLQIGGSDACQGDSGGPLVRIVRIRKRGRFQQKKAFLIGLVSRGIGCAFSQSPGIYLRMSTFLPWLRKHMEPDDTCINS